MARTALQQPYLDLFIEHRVPPEPMAASKLRNRARREISDVQNRLAGLPEASRNPTIADSRRHLSRRLRHLTERYEHWLSRVVVSRKHYRDWRPRQEDWIKLVMVMAARSGREGFAFTPTKESVRSERRYYLDRLLAATERLQRDTGQTAKSLLKDAAARTDRLIAEGWFKRPGSDEPIIVSMSPQYLEEQFSKRKNGKRAQSDELPPSLLGPLSAQAHFRALLSTGLHMSDWGVPEVFFSPDAIDEELEGRTRDDLRHRPMAAWESD